LQLQGRRFTEKIRGTKKNSRSNFSKTKWHSANREDVEKSLTNCLEFKTIDLVIQSGVGFVNPKLDWNNKQF
jgi:hypothetical protein